MAVGLCAEFWVYTEGEGASDDPLNVGVGVWTELLEVGGANGTQSCAHSWGKQATILIL